MKKLSIILFLVIALGIICLSLLIAPSQIENIYFWITISWFIFLTFINWLTSTLIFYGIDPSNTKNANFGILPSLGIVIFIYSILSAFFLLATWYINDFGLIPNWHLILQVFIALIAVILIILIFIAAKSSKKNINKNLAPKSLLFDYINTIENNNSDKEDLKESLKQLREIIEYNIPDINYIESINKYEELVDSLKKLSINNNVDEVKKIIQLAKIL